MHTFPSKTMFMSCDQPELLESYDNVLVFYNGVASTFGTIGELLLDNQSPIHKFLMPKQTSFREKDIELRARLA
jgi:ABC-type protease/lipase transport system fused ATPase/permease subunit